MMKRRICAIVLSIMTAISMTPMMAFADGVDIVNDEILQDETVEFAVPEDAGMQEDEILDGDRSNETIEDSNEQPADDKEQGDEELTIEDTSNDSGDSLPEETEANEIKEKDAADEDATIVASGSCGSRATWKLYSDGSLIIDGTGSISFRETTLNKDDVREVYINSGIESIETETFSHFRNLTNVTIPSSVTSIDYGAFYECSNLTDIIIPDSVTSMGDSVFSGCNSLTSVTIPLGLTSIGNYSFSGCSKLTSITLPEGVTAIGVAAFSGCGELTSITLPGGLTSIDSDLFAGCSNLTSIQIPEGVTSINRGAFSGCCNLMSIEIPESVTSIDSDAFLECSNLKSIEIPEGVASIGSYTFCGCSSLTDITMPNSVISFGSYAFAGCNSLKSITLPASLTSISSFAFSRCSNLTSIMIPDSVTTIETGAFRDCSGLKSIKIPESVTSISGFTFCGCSSLSDITIPNSIISIGESAFFGCSQLDQIVIPSGVTQIMSKAFGDCGNVNSIIIPDTVTAIAADAFKNTYGTIYTNSQYVYDWCQSNGMSVKVPASMEGSFINVLPKYGCINLANGSIVNLGDYLVLGNGVYIYNLAVSIVDETIVVYDNGRLAAASEGDTEIEITYAGKTTAIPVHVSSETVPATGLSLNKQNLDLEVGSTELLAASFSPVNAEMQDITWSTSNNSVVTVNNGFVKAVGKGTAIITATSGDYSVDCEIEVASAPLKELYAQALLTIEKGEQTKLWCLEYPAINDDTSPYSYVSEDPGIVSVSEDGIITANNPGITTVHITKNGVTTETVVSVVIPMTGISIEGAVTPLYKNSSCQLSVVFEPLDTTESKKVYWYSDAPDVARVDNDGKVTALKKGIAKITAQAGSFSSSCTIICVERPITEFSLDQTEVTLQLGEIEELQATWLPENTTDDTTITWKSSNPNVASVDIEGKVFAVSGGEADITATVGDHSATCKVTVDSEFIWSNMVHSGTCGSNVRWAIDNQGVLYIYGSGDMSFRQHPQAGEPTPPWNYGSMCYLSSIKRGVICEGVTNVGQNAFAGCSYLKSVSIPSSVKTISRHAFLDCGLTSITIPDSVEFIGDWAFNGESLKEVRYYGTEEEWDSISIVSGGNAPLRKGNIRYNCIKAPLSFALENTEYIYDGNAKEPLVSITDVYDNPLIRGTDYELIYQNNTAPGTASVLVKGMGKYQGEETLPFSIKIVNVEECLIHDLQNVVYSGSPYEPDCELEYNGKLLTKGIDYEVSYENNIDAGTATVHILGINNCVGSVTKTFVIEPKQIVPTIELSESEHIYNGRYWHPSITVKDGDTELPDSAYTVNWYNYSPNVGTKRVQVVLKGNYKGRATVSYTIIPADIAEVTDISFRGSRVFTGEPITGITYVMRGDTALQEGTDYTIEYSDNIEAGTATVVIHGIGNYTGEITKSFEIEPLDVEVLAYPSFSVKTYTGKPLTPSFTAKYEGMSLPSKTTDAFDVVYSDNTNVGTATIMVKGKGNFTGTKELYFTIQPKSIGSWIFPTFSAKTWDGKAKTPSFTCKDGSTKMVKGTNYTVTYSNNKNVGKAKVVIKGKGNYTGTKTLYFKINPKGTSLSSVSAASKGFTVKWKKQGTKMSSSQITGYQIQYSTSSTFATDNHTYKIKGVSNLSKKVAGLKGGKKYYVRVRTYKVVSGTTYYSSWSAKKSITTKK